MERTASTENPTPHKAPRKNRGDQQKGAPHERDEQTRIPHPYRRSPCNDAPAAPAAPSTTDEAKVLTALNLYRAKAGVSSPLTLDSGLKPAAEIAAKLVTSDKVVEEQDMVEFIKAFAGYKDAETYQPIGADLDMVNGKFSPKYVCMDSAELMAEHLSKQTDDVALEQLKSPDFKLVNIQTFKHGGVTYWVAVVAKSKVTT